MQMLTRPFLKSLATKAHKINPVVLIGSNGLTPQVHHEVDVALTAHELIKIRVNAETREERKAMIAEMAKKHKANIVQQIGHVLVLYRANAED